MKKYISSIILISIMIIFTYYSNKNELFSQKKSAKNNKIETRIKVLSNNNIIESVKIHNRGEPDGYRGKPIEIVLDRVLEENSDIKYEIVIITMTNFEIKGNGSLTTTNFYENPKKVWLKNMYLWLSRSDPKEKRDRITNEIVPGNIKSLRITITEKKYGFFSSEQIILADVLYNGL